MTSAMRPLILVTCDDGVESPGLRAAVRAVLDQGDVMVTAPCEQQSGAGRSLPTFNDGAIHAVLIDGVASVTPLSLDLTSRVAPTELETVLR